MRWLHRITDPVLRQRVGVDVMVTTAHEQVVVLAGQRENF